MNFQVGDRVKIERSSKERSSSAHNFFYNSPGKEGIVQHVRNSDTGPAEVSVEVENIQYWFLSDELSKVQHTSQPTVKFDVGDHVRVKQLTIARKRSPSDSLALGKEGIVKNVRDGYWVEVRVEIDGIEHWFTPIELEKIQEPEQEPELDEELYKHQFNVGDRALIRQLTIDRSPFSQMAVLQSLGKEGTVKSVRTYDNGPDAIEVEVGKIKSWYVPYELEKIEDAQTTKPIGHMHAELMLLYAQQALTDPEPWKNWQLFSPGCDSWDNLQDHPQWSVHANYRQQPNVIMIGNMEVPAPHRGMLPTSADRYYVPTLTGGSTQMWRSNVNYWIHEGNGAVHLTQEAADQHSIALIALTAAQR